MATPLGIVFSTAENQVSQCDDQTLGSIAEILVINFVQEKFEQLLTRGSKNPLRVRKHRKVTVANVLLATSEKQVSIEATEILHEPNSASSEANKALRKPNLALHEPITVPTWTKFRASVLALRASLQRFHTNLK